MNVQVNEVPVRRLTGIDLGVASEHTVRVLDGAGQKIAAARCVPTRESLLAAEARALAGTPAGTGLEVVLEPPARRGSRSPGSSPPVVTRCSGCPRPRPPTCGSSTGGTRRATGSTPTPSPGCRWPTRTAWSAHAGRGGRGHPWIAGCGPATGSPPPAARHKTRIKALIRQELLPMTPLTGDLGKADLAILERYADPRALLDSGARSGLTALISQASHGKQGPEHGPQAVDQRRAASISTCTGPPTRPCPMPTWPPRWPPRSACSTPSRPSSRPRTRPPARRTPTAKSAPARSPGRLPALAEIGDPRPDRGHGQPRPFAQRPPTSSPTLGLAPRATARPATPTARASR